MKTIINYLKKRQDERLRAKIALKTGHNVDDFQTVYEFIKGGSLSGQGVFSDKMYLKGSFRNDTEGL